MLARLFVIIGGLIVLALTAALVVPPFVDWTGYRADFEREASAVLGRKVTVNGEARARLLPFPSVTFSDVSVGGVAEGEPALTMETFSMDAELAPFLRGEFLIFDMRMVRPKGTIDIAEDGAVDWTVRPSAPFDAGHVAIEKLTVTEGSIVVRHAGSGRTHRISEIDADVSAKALTGPWRVAGTMRLDGMRTAVSVSTGTVDEAGAMRLRLRLDPATYPATVETDGSVRLRRGAPVYAGRFRLAPKAEPAPAGAPQPDAAAARADPGFRLNGAFTLDHAKMSVDEFLFETGPLDNPYTAEGTAAVDLGREPRFSLVASGAQVRFDEAVGGGDGPGLSFAQRLAALEEALIDLPRPTIPGTIEVNLPAVVAGDTTVREVRLSAEPAAAGWTIRSFAATLPGRTTLEASGALSVEPALGFKGSLLVAVGQPSGFAAWLARDVDEAIRRLPAAGFQADVDLSRQRQVFGNLELGLGNAQFRGEAENRAPDDARPSTALMLSGGALDVDGLAAFVALFVDDSGESRFADRDLDLSVKAGPVSAGGLSAKTVDTALRLRGGTLEIDRLSISDLAGTTVSATGRLENVADRPSGSIDASLLAIDMAPLVEAIAARYPDNAVAAALASRAAAYPSLFENARLDVVASANRSGDLSELALSAQGDAGGTALSATLSARGRLAAPADAELSLSFSGRNDDSTALLALYGLPALPLGLAGSGETEITARGTLAGGLDTTARLASEDAALTFAGAATFGAAGAMAKGRVGLDAADVEPWLMTLGAALPGMGTGLPVTLDAEADYADGLLVLSDLDGAVAEGAVAGDVNVGLKAGRPQLTGQLTVDAVDLEPLLAMVLGAPALEPTTAGWSTVPFAQSVAAPFGADLDLRAATLTAGPAATAYDAQFDLRLDDEGLRLSGLSATLFDGKATGDLEIRNTAGTGLLSGQVALAGADLKTLLGDAGLAGRSDLALSMSASGKSVGALVASLSGSGTAALKDLVVEGVDPDALPALVAQADRAGRDIDAAKVAAFAPGIVGAGSFSAAPAEAAFTLAGGVLRAPPLRLDNPAATIEANVQADLDAGTVAVGGEIAYRPGDDALVGSEPVMRFSVEGPPETATRRFDSEPMAQFLTQRALEIEQARVEAMQAALLEKQRLRREVRYYAALQDERDRAADLLRQAQEKLRAEEEARKAAARAEVEAAERRRLAAEEAARRAAEPPAVELVPLPPPPREEPAPAAPAPQTFEPQALDGFMKTLQGVQ